MNASEALSAMNGRRILIVGDVMLDSYIAGNVDRISPEAPVPVVEYDHEEHRLGGAANVALNVAALGGIPLLVAAVGHDESGERLRTTLAQEGLEDDGLVEIAERPTTQKLRVLSRGHQLLRIDRETREALPKEAQAEVLRKLKSSLAGADVVILQDYDKGVLTAESIPPMLEACREAGVPVCVDPKVSSFFAYQGVTLFKPNAREVQQAMGDLPKMTNPARLRAMVAELKQRLHAEAVLITLGSEGAWLSAPNADVHIPAYDVRRVSDVSGAGDTVIGTMAMALAAGLSFVDAATLANTAGGLVCEDVGVVPINLARLRKAILTNPNQS